LICHESSSSIYQISGAYFGACLVQTPNGFIVYPLSAKRYAFACATVSPAATYTGTSFNDGYAKAKFLNACRDLVYRALRDLERVPGVRDGLPNGSSHSGASHSACHQTA